MAYYTTNFVNNPNFQNGLTSYTAVNGATLSLDPNNVQFGGQNSLLVETDGLVSNQGCFTDDGVIPDVATASASVSLRGSGVVTVTAFTNPGNVAAIIQTVTLTDLWQRITLNGISCTPGMQIYLAIETSSPQEATIWVAGVQVERTSPATSYCDGDQAGCFWLTPGASFGVSFRPYQNNPGSVGNTVSVGDVVPVLHQGATFNTSAEGHTSDYGGVPVNALTGNPVASFADFSVFKSTDPDPAQTYVGWNNGGTNSGTGGSYNRIWAEFYPPRDYFVSGGAQLWKRAAYMAVGYQFNTVPAAGTQNIARVQAEILPITTAFGQPTPSTYDEPRKIHTIVKPDRLNYCPNPSFETSTASWSAIGTATLAVDGTKNAGNIIIYDDFQFTAGTKSMKVTVNHSGDGAQINISNLIVGNTYVVSAYLQAGPGLLNLNMACEAGSAGAATSGLPYGDSIYAYGTGEPYGGILPGVDLTQNIWFRPSFTFTAVSSTETLVITSTSGSDVVYPTQFWVDAVLVELGQDLNIYFDGNFGTNYFWEGTANLSRSYFYDQYSVKQAAVTNALSRHIPYGINFATPLFKVPYTQ